MSWYWMVTNDIGTLRIPAGGGKMEVLDSEKEQWFPPWFGKDRIVTLFEIITELMVFPEIQVYLEEL